MIANTDLNVLSRYKTWADSVFYEAIASLPSSELTLSRPMLFNNILSLLHHIYAMDLVWKAHLEGVPHGLDRRNPTCPFSFAELQESQVAVNLWYEDYTANLGPHQASETVKFQFIGGGDGQMRRFEIIQHCVNHASYHRGHIEGVLYQLSIEPPTTDLPVFIREMNPS